NQPIDWAGVGPRQEAPRLRLLSSCCVEQFNSSRSTGPVDRGGRMSRSFASSLLNFVLLVTFAHCGLFAQDLATLKLTVTDPTGAVIPGVNVTATNSQTGAKRTDITESHGLSVIPGLAPGAYDVVANAQGFAPRKF